MDVIFFLHPCFWRLPEITPSVHLSYFLPSPYPVAGLPFFALCPIVARAARQLTADSLEARRAGAVAGSNAALASHTLALTTTLGTPPALLADAAAGILHTGRGVALAIEAAAVAPQARRAYTGSSGLVTACCWVALTWATTCGCPPARVAVAQACLWVTLSMGAAGAGELTELAPVVGLALAHTGGWFTLATWMAGAGLTTVVAPVLAWTAC